MDHKVCLKGSHLKKKKKSTELWFFVSLEFHGFLDGYLWILENCLYFDALLFLQLHLSLYFSPHSSLILFLKSPYPPFISMLFFLFCNIFLFWDLLLICQCLQFESPRFQLFDPLQIYIYLHISVYYVYLFGVDNSCFFFLTFWMIW